MGWPQTDSILFSLSHHLYSIIVVILSFLCHSIMLLVYNDIMILLYYHIIVLLDYSANILPPAPPGHCHCLSHTRPSAIVLSVAMSSLEAVDNSAAEDGVFYQNHQSAVGIASPDARPTAAA